MNEPLTMEQYQQLLALGSENEGLDQEIAMQLAQAKAMRDRGAPQLRDAGTFKMAPGALETLGGIASQGGAAFMDSKAKEGMKSRSNNTSAQNNMLLQAILSGAQQPQPLGGTGLLPPTGQGQGLLPRNRGPFSLGGDY
jgi:hypothetical protein